MEDTGGGSRRGNTRTNKTQEEAGGNKAGCIIERGSANKTMYTQLLTNDDKEQQTYWILPGRLCDLI